MTTGPMATGPGGDELRIRRHLRQLGLGIRSGEPETAYRPDPPLARSEPRRPDPLPLVSALPALLFLAGLVTALLRGGQW
ncbi:hypothetical protein [Streptomyces sp. NPDC007346]|uniref:hypothetical protein n=1 Tax=Streptomyces sp. NPDC007346 TaxID=3154682 RepID=UPI003451AC36